VFWVDVSTTTSAESGFLAIGSRLNLAAPGIDDVLQSLANIKHRWLLILDNADDTEVDYQQYFPTGCTGVIILTSRNSECRQYATNKIVALEGLPPNEAQELLLRAAHITTFPLDAYKRDAMLDVTSLLKGHPLALLQAGAYVARGHCSLAEYPRIFRCQRKRLLTFRPDQARSRYGDVYATFEASADILQASQSEASSDALQLLSMLAMLAPSRLPLSLFQVIWQGARDILLNVIDDKDEDEDGDVGHLTTWHVSHLLPLIGADEETWDSFRLVEAVHLLEAYSLVAVSGLGDTMSITMHPLTHAWARDRQEVKQQQQSWLTTGCMIAVSGASGMCSAASASGARWSFWQVTQRQLRPHLQALMSIKVSRTFNYGPHLMVARILLLCGWLLSLLRVDKELFALIQDLFTTLSLDQQVADRKWIELYHLKGRNLSNHGQFQRAVVLLEQVVRIQEQTQAEDNIYRLDSQHELAVAYLANGQVKQAVTILEQVVRIAEQKLAEDHPDRLASQHELARAYEANGQVKQAVTLLEQVVRIREQTLAEDHPDRLISQQVLAAYLWELGYFDIALPMVQNVVAVQRVSLDEQHPRRESAEKWLRYMDSKRKNSN